MADRYRKIPKDPYESYPGSIYTEFSPKDKKRHIRAIEKDLMESGFDWTQQDAILRNERQRLESLSLFRASGAFFEGDKLNLSKVNTKEKKKMYERSSSMFDNLAAKYGGRGTEYENLPWSDLEKEDPSWSNLGEALVGTGKDIGGDLYNLTRYLGSYPLYGIPGINADVEGFLDKYMPWIEGPEKSRYQGSGFRYNEPSVDEDSWLNFLNVDGGGFLGKSSVPEVNPWKGFANRARVVGDAVPAGLASYFLGRSGIAPLVNKLPNVMQKTIGQVLPFISRQGTFFPKYTGKPTKFWSDKLGHLKNRKWNPFTTQPSTYRNVAFGLPTLGAATAAQDVLGQGVSISDDWGRDSDPVVFDDYVSERMERRREPRVIRSQDEQRGPGPWNEFRG